MNGLLTSEWSKYYVNTAPEMQIAQKYVLTSLAMASASMTGTPISLKIFAVLLFPAATPPVRPTRNILCRNVAVKKNSKA